MCMKCMFVSAGPDGLVCYYYGPRSSVYESLGHAEVTQLELGGRMDSAEVWPRLSATAFAKEIESCNHPHVVMQLNERLIWAGFSDTRSPDSCTSAY